MSKTITVHVPMRFAIRGGRKTIVSEVEYPKAQPRIENALLKALAKAYRWRHQIENGEYASITELANAQRVNESYACRLLRLTLLSPEIVAEILNGRQRLTLKKLTKPFSLQWDQQSLAFGVGQYRHSAPSQMADCADQSIGACNGSSHGPRC